MAYEKALRIYDIDGVLVKWRKDGVFEVETPPCQDTIDQLNAQYDSGDWIVIWTARGEWNREATEKYLISLGIKFHVLFMDKNAYIEVYDDNQVICKVNHLEPQTFLPEGDFVIASCESCSGEGYNSSDICHFCSGSGKITKLNGL